MSYVSNHTTENGALALVATTTYLLLVNLSTKQVAVIESERPEYYGITWHPDGNELVLSHSASDNATLIDINSYANSETGYLSKGSFITDPFLSAPHQILYASDGRIVCTNTGRNAITVVDLEKPGVFHEKRVSEARWDRLSLESITGDHLNSVFEQNGTLYVIAHGHKKGSQLIELDYPSLDTKSVRPIQGRTGLHNVWVTEEGQKIACHSNIGALVDIASNTIIWEAGSRIYTRGLAASSDMIVVGESQMTDRDLRRSSTSALWILEPNSFKTLDYIYLGPFGAVNEVRLLNRKDFAHHGHLFSNISQLKEKTFAARLQLERLQTAHAVKAESTVWSNYELIFGYPQRLENGSRKSTPDNLCLVVRKSRETIRENRIQFHYELPPSNVGAHVSAVIYSGTGEDTHMHAFLIQPIDEIKCALSIWSHDGSNWATTPEFEAIEVPPVGTMDFVHSTERVLLYVDGEIKITLPNDRLHVTEGRLGIRWINASVRPLEQAG